MLLQEAGSKNIDFHARKRNARSVRNVFAAQNLANTLEMAKNISLRKDERERERETLYKINHIKLNAISHRAKKWSCNALLWSLPQNGDRALNAFSTNLICPSYCCGSIKWCSTAHTSYRIWCFYIDATSYTHKHMAQSKSAVRCIRFSSITSRSPYTCAVRCGDGHILSYGATLCIRSLE